MMISLSNISSTAGAKGRTVRAFTLIEILIVVVILGILAAIIVPQLSNATSMARDNTLKDDLRYLRTQIVVFKAQHRDVPPGYPAGDMAASPTAEAFVAQMTRYTSESTADNISGSTVFKYGPYLTKMPPNPLNSKDGILMVGNGQPMPDPDNSQSYGWIYKAETQEIIANSAGSDSDGRAYSSY